MATPHDRRLAGLPPIPIHGHVGLEVLGFASGSCDERLHVPPWMLDGDGRPTLGAAALVADSAIGWAVSSMMPAGMAMVTAQLRIELTRAFRPGEATVRSRSTGKFADADVGFGSSDLLDGDDEIIGAGSLRAAPVHVRGREQAGAPLDADVGPGAVAATTAEALEEHGAVSGDGTGALSVRCQPHLSNSSGGVHGGVIALMAERAVRLAVASVADPDALRPLDLDIVYLRRLAADGSIVRAHAGVLLRSRRFVTVMATVDTPEGAPAAQARASYALPAP
jgi:acyl-coenzyme A thioesterase PaaI-like protein